MCILQWSHIVYGANWSYFWSVEDRKKKSEIIRKTNNKPSIPGNEGGPSINEAELERPLLSTSGPFDHLPHCQVPPAECFIISPSKCLRLAKSTEALLCATRCHSGLLGSTGEQQGFWEIINGGKKTWFSLISAAVYFAKMPEAYDKNGYLSPFVVYMNTPGLNTIHQIVKDIKINYLTGGQGYLYHTVTFLFLLTPCWAEGNKACTQ